MQRETEKEKDLIRKAMENINNRFHDQKEGKEPYKPKYQPVWEVNFTPNKSIEAIRDYLTKNDLPSWEVDELRNKIDSMLDKSNDDSFDIPINFHENTESMNEFKNRMAKFRIDNIEKNDPQYKYNKEEFEDNLFKQFQELNKHKQEQYHECDNENPTEWFNENFGKAMAWLKSDKAETDEIINPKPVLAFVRDFINRYMASDIPEFMAVEFWSNIETLVGTWLDRKYNYLSSQFVFTGNTTTSPANSTEKQPVIGQETSDNKTKYESMAPEDHINQQDKKLIRSHNVGESDYSKHKIQPWDIWEEYNLNPWDADIVKRTLRTKQEPGKTPEESRIADYRKIIHVAQERIRQIQSNGHV